MKSNNLGKFILVIVVVITSSLLIMNVTNHTPKVISKPHENKTLHPQYDNSNKVIIPPTNTSDPQRLPLPNSNSPITIKPLSSENSLY